MNVEFSDITYTVKKSWKEKGDGTTILHGLSGTFRTGQLTAIMGPSGAGKSTLLNVISGFTSSGVKGSMKINGRPLNRRLFHKSSRYIQQEDVLPAQLTTKECMVIAASLKLPSDTTPIERETIVNETLAILGLTAAAKTKTEMLSGGQRKRLSIALELINNPHIFFLDEPTSGLDNVSTKQTLMLLNQLAKGGRTIVCTIHQPSAALLDLFDGLYIVGKGRCVYQGSVQNLLPFLSSAGYKCPTYHNPADYLIEVIDGNSSLIDVMSKAIENGRITHTPSKEALHQLDYEQFRSHLPLQPGQISRQSSSDGSDGVFANLQEYKRIGMAASLESQSSLSSWQQFHILLTSMALQVWRNKLCLKFLLVHHISCALLIGAIFYQKGNNARHFFDLLKLCIGLIVFIAYTYTMTPVLTYPTQIKLVKKEYFNRWYSFHPYYAALTVTRLPGQIFFSMIFNILVYVLCGFPLEWSRFFIFSLVIFLTVLTSDALGLAIGSIFNITNGSAIGPAALSPFLGFAVFGLDFARNITWYLRALLKMSFMRCGFFAIILTLCGMDREPLDCDEPFCYFQDPKSILHFVDMDNASVWTEIFFMTLLCIIFKVISYMALRIKLTTGVGV